MPFDQRVEELLRRFARQRTAFLGAIGSTIDQVRTYLGVHATGNGTRARVVQAELGAFAHDRIDFDRFASLFADREVVDPVAFEIMEQALTTLSNLAAMGDHLFVVKVEPGQGLGGTVGRALSEIGRAFGAARVFELSRTGQYRYSAHARDLGSFPFASWNRTERRMAPPVFVEVAGADVHASGLSEYLDGAQKVVLVVDGECAPAPLVRLITPQVFVTQCGDGGDLERFAAWDGPGVAAIVPESAALFAHDPAAGSRPYDRMTLVRLPERSPRSPIGGLSVAQQVEELDQLRALAERPTVSDSGLGPPGTDVERVAAQPPVDPVDKLAAWLLRQADLADVE